ncbi:MAG TPA: thymidylate kinase, partial [bacterium]|nr:thymidylate kinase [bacterium]
IGLDPDPATSFKIFQARVIEEFNNMIREFGFFVVDGEKPIHTQQRIIRDYFKKFLAPTESS